MLKKYDKELPAGAFRTDDIDALSRTPKGLRFEAMVQKAHDLADDPKHMKDMELVVERLKSSTPGATQTVQLLENLSVAYANDELIGERLMPVIRCADALGLSIEYWKKDKPDGFGAPSDEMTSEGDANDISAGATRASVSLTKRSLKGHIDLWNKDMMASVVQELVDPTLEVAGGMALNQELRLATILCASGNFGSNTTAIAAGDRWDSAAGGDPGGVVDTARAALWSGRGMTRLIGYCSWDVYRILKRHAKILDTFKYNNNAPMQATRTMLAEYFELDDLLVGAARKQTSNEGQATQTYSRIWSNVFGLVRVAATPTRQSLHFGSTFQQRMFQQTWTDQTKGGRGVVYTQLSTAVAHPIVAADAGYLITTPIS